MSLPVLKLDQVWSYLRFIRKITSSQSHLSALAEHCIALYSCTAFQIVLHGACFGTGRPLFVATSLNGIHSAYVEGFEVPWNGNHQTCFIHVH